MMTNLFADIVSTEGQERFDDVLRHQGLRVERIVSHGQASPEGFWYDQNWDEWVLVLSGQAELEFEDRVLTLGAGSHVMIAAHQRHRVKSTTPNEATVWLALHWESI